MVLVRGCSFFSEASRSTHCQHVETACSSILHRITGHISCKYKHMTMMTFCVYSVCVCVYIHTPTSFACLLVCRLGIAVRACMNVKLFQAKLAPSVPGPVGRKPPNYGLLVGVALHHP